MPNGKRGTSAPSSAAVEARVNARMEKYYEWKTYAVDTLIAHKATNSDAEHSAFLIWDAASHFADVVQRGTKPARYKPAMRKELARLANALADAREAINSLGSDAQEILLLEARRPRIIGLIGGGGPKGPAHPNAAEIVARLYDKSPLEPVEWLGSTVLMRRYAPSLAGDIEILGRVADSAARTYRAPRGSRPSHGGPFLNSCIWAWRKATGRLPVKTRDTDRDANEERDLQKVSPLYAMILRALDAIQLPASSRPGVSRTSFYNAICDAEATEKDLPQGILSGSGGSLGRQGGRRAARLAVKKAGVSK
jgi:hypothetical protein